MALLAAQPALVNMATPPMRVIVFIVTVIAPHASKLQLTALLVQYLEVIWLISMQLTFPVSILAQLLPLPTKQPKLATLAAPAAQLVLIARAIVPAVQLGIGMSTLATLLALLAHSTHRTAPTALIAIITAFLVLDHQLFVLFVKLPHLTLLTFTTQQTALDLVLGRVPKVPTKTAQEESISAFHAIHHVLIALGILLLVSNVQLDTIFTIILALTHVLLVYSNRTRQAQVNAWTSM